MKMATEWGERRTPSQVLQVLHSIGNVLTSELQQLDELNSRCKVEYRDPNKVSSANKPSNGKYKTKGDDKAPRELRSTDPNDICKGCGWSKLKTSDGRLKCPRNKGAGCGNDPRRNNTTTPWIESAVGKAWRAKGYQSIPPSTLITVENAIPKSTTAAPATKKKKT